jgi:hypothetical protein
MIRYTRSNYLHAAVIRAGQAAANLFGVQYQQRLLDSITEVRFNLNKLVEQAQISDVVGTREAMHLILQGTRRGYLRSFYTQPPPSLTNYSHRSRTNHASRSQQRRRI